ncbi:MAG: thioesterase family protein [Planctomycetota bacterium]|nr:thioesterase family protein [Planctomycetota bacterium]
MVDDASQPPPHRHHLLVRYGETDQMGRVHHANYLLYFEEARTGMMRELGASYAGLERRGVGLPVRKADLRYRQAALYEEELVVETRITRVGPASVTFEYRCLREADGGLVATGSTELACIDLADGRLIHLPADMARVFRGAQGSAE